MKIYRLTQANIDTRSQNGRNQANKMVFDQLGGLNVNDILNGVPNVAGSMHGSSDVNYQILSVNPDYTVNLLAIESHRQMPNACLYGMDKRQNIVPRWQKQTGECSP